MHTLESHKDFVHTKSLRYLCIQSQKCAVHTFYFLRTSSPNPFVKSMSTVVASNVFGHPKTDHGHFNSDKKNCPFSETVWREYSNALGFLDNRLCYNFDWRLALWIQTFKENVSVMPIMVVSMYSEFLTLVVLLLIIRELKK